MPEYGNVSEDDVEVMQDAVQVAANVLAQLPAAMSEPWRQIAYEIVLGGILNDWVVNETEDLDNEDAADLANLVRLSHDLAVQQDYALRDIAFRTLVKYAIADWVENWNAEE